jgi:uncharacterized protein YfkK (UPF0435 family)
MYNNEKKYMDVYASIENLESKIEVIHLCLNILNGRLFSVSKKVTNPIEDNFNLTELLEDKKTYLGKRIQESANKVDYAISRVQQVIKHLEI